VGRRLAATTAVIAAAMGTIAGRTLTRFEVVEESMAPSLLPGDYLVARRAGAPARGHVVIYEHPQRSGFYLIKRVVGLPGETVDVAEGRLTIDGAVLEEPWANGPTPGNGHWPLAMGEVFVMGDSRVVSTDDSRYLGPVPVSHIEWRAVARYWPPTRAGRPASS
jgi:signal peptidase I